MKAAFYTLGCKANQFETQALERLFAASGWELADFEEEADLYVINTCAVTATAGKKSRNIIRRARDKNEKACVAVCGCYAEVSAEELKRECGADIVIGSRSKASLPPMVEEWFKGVTPELRIMDDFEALPAGGLSGRTRALLKVQDGCENFCTYCIIPYTRGKCISMPLERVISEAARLQHEGYKEIIVTGIEISSWGEDLPGKPGMETMIAAVCEAAPGARIRLGSLEPCTLTSEFASKLKNYKNLCPHFHLSLQSGCTKTLEAMHRHYNAEQFYDVVNMLRMAWPGCALTADLIVGFPGETEEDFRESLDFVEKCRLSQTHVFPYSKRPGTPAASMPLQVPRTEKMQRAGIAGRLCAALHNDFLASKVGTETEVLCEQPGEDGWWGYSPEYCRVFVKNAGGHNELVKVRLVSAEKDHLVGMPL